jgi:hypothetical protein
MAAASGKAGNAAVAQLLSLANVSTIA